MALLFAGDRAMRRLRSGSGSRRAKPWCWTVTSIRTWRSSARNSSEEERRALKRWILDTEYGYYRLPRPDVSLFLDVPFSFTERKLTQAREGGDRDYLQGAHDIHEASLDLQQRVRGFTSMPRARMAFRVVDCCAPDGSMETPERIFFRKIEAALALLLNAAADA